MMDEKDCLSIGGMLCALVYEKNRPIFHKIPRMMEALQIS